MKKVFLVITIALAVVLLGIGSYFYFSYINRERPATPIGLVVISPNENQEVTSPLKITGYVNGDGWVGFEGQVGSVQLVVDGVALAQAPLTAKGDWMTASPIDFETNLEFQVSGDKVGTLVFNNENPSGSYENERQVSLPLVIKGIQGETSIVKVYFGKTSADSTCNVVFPTNRIIPKTDAVARAALEELLKGTTSSEASQGFVTIINQGVKIQSLTITNGVAMVDFDEQLESTGGSCRVAAIRAQITQTLKQFPTVEGVIISIGGRTEDILQP